MIIDPGELYKRLLKLKKETSGPKSGVSVGFLDLNEFVLLSKKYLMLVTGMGGMGKSEFVDAIALNTAIEYDWKWCFYSPENFPTEEHVKKFIERYLGKGLWETTPKEIEGALEFLTKYFTWIDSAEDDDPPSVNNLLEVFKKIKNDKGLDAFVIDPWNEVDHSAQAHQRDDQYIGDTLTKIRRFNRRQDLLGTIVIHPKGLSRDKEGNFPVPSLSDCHGGVMWRNKADYGLCFHRHDMKKDELTVYIQKIKFKWMGKVGCLDMIYDKRSGRFKGVNEPEFLLPDQIVPPF